MFLSWTLLELLDKVQACYSYSLGRMEFLALAVFLASTAFFQQEQLELPGSICSSESRMIGSRQGRFQLQNHNNAITFRKLKPKWRSKRWFTEKIRKPFLVTSTPILLPALAENKIASALFGYHLVSRSEMPLCCERNHDVHDHDTNVFQNIQAKRCNSHKLWGDKNSFKIAF